MNDLNDKKKLLTNDSNDKIMNKRMIQMINEWIIEWTKWLINEL